MKIIKLNNRVWIVRRSVLALVTLLLSGSLQAQHRGMTANTHALDSLRSSLVDVAYGKQKQKSITSAINTIYSEDLEKRNTPSISNALMGKIPGLYVRNSSGMPGAGVELAIRGQGTYATTQPLVMVDGFRTDYDQLSMYEIESISVLKDASATVLYGMEAANGVILITTKRGKVGKLNAKVNLQYGIHQPTQMPELLNAVEYATYFNQARVNDGLPMRYDPINEIPNYGKGGDYRYTHPDNDYFKEFLRPTAPVMNAGVNLYGGSESAQYSAIVSYMGNRGFLDHAERNDYSTQLKQDRINVRTNLDVVLMKGLKTSVDAAISFDKNNYPGVNIGDLLNSMMQLPPQAFAINNPDGSLGGSATYKQNPMGMIGQSGYMTSLRRNLDINIGLGYDFSGKLKGLSVGASAAISTYMTIWDNKIKQYDTYSIDDPYDLDNTTYSRHGEVTDLAWLTNVQSNKRLSFESNVKYNRTFGEHTVNGLVMWHMDRFVQNLVSTPYNFDNAGLGARFGYNYSEKYFVELAASYYGQEQYRKGNRYKFFPAASAAWIASNEEFLKDNKVVNYLKTRVSYGIVGGGSGVFFPGIVSRDRLMYNQYYNKIGSPTFGETNSYAPSFASYVQGALASPNISCDMSRKFNIGLEATLFNHINLSLDYFNDKRTDIIAGNNMIPGTMGFAGRSGLVNGGQVNNQGLELMLNYFGQTGDFRYEVTGIMSHNKSKLVKKPDIIPLPGVDNRSGIGMPVGQLMGYQAIGFYESDAAAQNAVVKQSFGPTQAGDVIYKDITGDNLIDISDMIPLGYSYMPQYDYSISVDLMYKNFSLSLMGQGIMNSSVMLGGLVVPFSTQGNAYRQFAKESWSPDNMAAAKYPRLSTISNDNNNQRSSVWLSSRDYFKLRNIEIGYDFPKKWLSKLSVSSARIYILGIDLFTHSKELKHLDPETLSIYPASKSYNIGLSLTF